MTFSIIIPAHDEERWLGGGIAACREAQVRLGQGGAGVPPAADVEIIVVLNRCTDRTEEIARAAGAVVVREDVDFALRLKAHGRLQGQRFGTLRRAPITTSCRKFDRFGDWFAIRMLLRHPVRLHRALHAGDHAALADKLFYDFEH